MPKPSRKRILLVAVNWLGDLIFMTPVIRAIRRAHPDAYIACLAPPRGLDLLEGNPHLNAVIPLKERRGLLGLFQWWPVIHRLKRERFDTAFLFHRSFTRALVAWAAGIRSRIGYRTWKQGWLLTQGIDPAPSDTVHKVTWFLQLLEPAGIPADGLHYEVGLLAEDKKRAAQLLKEWGIQPEDRVVALHAGANWRLKRWPADHFAQLADRLTQQFHAKVLFIGDRGDLPLIQGILNRMQSHALVAAGRTTFRQLGALLSKTSLLISNDSGPLHLGLAVGTPVVALFGPTDPNLTGPTDGAKAVTPPPALSAEGGAFVESRPFGPKSSGRVTLFGSIGCPVPCYQLNCPVNLCMQQITVDQVVEAAGRLLTP